MSSISGLSFELPLENGMPAEHQALLYNGSSFVAVIELKDVGLSGLPKAFNFNNTRYVYVGVSDGRGHYRQDSEATK